jgi:hypothetical protein
MGSGPVVVVPYVHGMLNLDTWRLVQHLVHPHRFEDIDPNDGGAYSRLFRRLWAAGETFIICEHDVVPTVGQIATILSCDHDWCSFRYDGDAYPGGPMFGLCRFDRRVMAAHPLTGEYATMADRELGIERSWHDLDAYVARDLLIRGVTWREHLPPVRHVREDHRKLTA